MPESELNKKPAAKDWIRFLSVFQKRVFYTLNLFAVFYEIESEYGKTASLMDKEVFMKMKRGLSVSPQHVLNSSYDFTAGEDNTGDLEE